MTRDERLNNINTIIAEFCGKFGCRVSRQGEFCYIEPLKMVCYELDFGHACRMNREFMASVKRWRPQIKLNVFVWSLLHELGHCMTWDNFDDEEYERIYKKKARIWGTKATLPYYRLPDEMAATKWAVEYANTHKAEIKEFWEKLLPEVDALFALLRKG